MKLLRAQWVLRLSLASMRNSCGKVEAADDSIVGVGSVTNSCTGCGHVSSGISRMLGNTPDSLTSGPMTDQLRRQRLHGLNKCLPKMHRSRLTNSGSSTILRDTRIYNRVLCPKVANHIGPSLALQT